MAMSMVWGRPINPRNIERLVEDALKTLQEFGVPGDDVQTLLEGPFSDPAARREFQNRAIQRTARRLARVSPYYRQLFAEHGIEPAKLTVETIHQVPTTVKRMLQDRQQEFVASDTQPYISTRTTGTTGHPAEIWLSAYEIELWPALAALSGLLRNEINPRDCMQINISSRATAAVQMNIKICRLAGARARMLGVIPPDESLDSLLSGGDEAPTLLSVYPSYLAQLVHAARRRGLSARDFHLRRADCGGEVLSPSLARATLETLGARANDTFAMTEILPVGGRTCTQGHLHMDLNIGFVEIIDPQTGMPAAPGELGTLVVTPYYPYRECTPLLRYDTRDLVRRLPDEPLTCELAGVPATSNILGKADHLLHVNGQVVPLRDIVELLEALPSQPWPARFKVQECDGMISLMLPEETLCGVTKEQVEQRFCAAGMPVRVVPCQTSEQELTELRPLRADLRETTFATRRD
jgi:phenylacetate-coenzyme A ligase PaaK-like adenylate-forming protein